MSSRGRKSVSFRTDNRVTQTSLFLRDQSGRGSSTSVELLYKYINTIALYRGQWQYKKPQDMSNPDSQRLGSNENVRPIFERKQRELGAGHQAGVKWGYLLGAESGNDLIVYQRTPNRTVPVHFSRNGDPAPAVVSATSSSLWTAG